jgi:hypothetical protein
MYDQVPKKALYQYNYKNSAADTRPAAKEGSL